MIGGRESGQADLADPARAELVDLLVRVIEEVHVDRRHVGVDRHDVVGQVAVDRRAVLRVVGRVLEQRHADAHHDRALDLVAAGQRIEDSAGVDDRDDAADAQPGDLRLPGDLDEVAAEGVRRELRLRIAEGRLGLAVARDEAQVGAPQHVGERDAPWRDRRPSRRPGRPRSARSSGCALFERRSGRAGRDRRTGRRSRRRPPRRRPGSPSRSPSSRPRSGPSGSVVSPSTTSTLSSGTPVFSEASCARIV